MKTIENHYQSNPTIIAAAEREEYFDPYARLRDAAARILGYADADDAGDAFVDECKYLFIAAWSENPDAAAAAGIPRPADTPNGSEADEVRWAAIEAREARFDRVKYDANDPRCVKAIDFIDMVQAVDYELPNPREWIAVDDHPDNDGRVGYYRVKPTTPTDEQQRDAAARILGYADAAAFDAAINGVKDAVAAAVAATATATAAVYAAARAADDAAAATAQAAPGRDDEEMKAFHASHNAIEAAYDAANAAEDAANAAAEAEDAVAAAYKQETADAAERVISE